MLSAVRPRVQQAHFTMSLLKYFHPKASKLDEERFPLSKVVPSSEITAINSSVKDEKKRSVRAPYLILTPAQRYELGRRAAEHGVTLTIHYYAPDLDLKETSVQRFKNSYQASLKLAKNAPATQSGDQNNLQELVPKKTGRPLMLGEELDQQVRYYLRELRDRGGIINMNCSSCWNRCGNQ